MSKLNCILLVDDDEGTNFYHSLILKDMDITHHIQHCIDGRDALDYLTNQGAYVNNGTIYPRPDMILLDINMPGMNGFEFLDGYKELPEDQKGNLIIVMLTTSLLEDDRAKAESYEEVTSFLNKPLNEEIVAEIVSKYLVK